LTGWAAPGDAVWPAFRAVLPFDDAPGIRERPIHEIAAAFILGNAAARFYPANEREPDAGARAALTPLQGD
jgi:hypothetical protein